MLAEVVALLACPHCAAELEPLSGSLHCTNGHTFDIARSGYVSLLAAHANASTSDTAAMVAARARFLASGHFEPLAVAVSRAASDALAATRTPLAIVEIGAGTGFYLGRVLDDVPAAVGLALDVSKHAARLAARAHARISAVVCDVWAGIPVKDGSIDLVLDVFAPRNAVEIARILRPEGTFVVATPTSRHLAELVGPLGLITVDDSKERRVSESLAGMFERTAVEPVEAELSLSHQELLDLVSMGPSARHVTTAELAERIATLPTPARATLSAQVTVYHRRTRATRGA